MPAWKDVLETCLKDVCIVHLRHSTPIEFKFRCHRPKAVEWQAGANNSISLPSADAVEILTRWNGGPQGVSIRVTEEWVTKERVTEDPVTDELFADRREPLGRLVPGRETQVVSSKDNIEFPPLPTVEASISESAIDAQLSEDLHQPLSADSRYPIPTFYLSSPVGQVANNIVPAPIGSFPTNDTSLWKAGSSNYETVDVADVEVRRQGCQSVPLLTPFKLI